MTKEVGIGSTAHDFFPDLVIKCFTSSSFSTSNLSKEEIAQVDDVSVVECNKEESLRSERMHYFDFLDEVMSDVIGTCSGIPII